MEKKYKKFGEMCFWLGIMIETLVVLIDKSAYINPYESLIFRFTFLLFGIKIITTKYSAIEWTCIVLAGVLAFISYYINERDEMVRAVVLIAACKNISLQKEFKTIFYLTVAGCCIIVILARAGLLGAMSVTTDYGRGGIETRYVFGMGHPNAFGVSLKKDELNKAIILCNSKLKLEDLVTIHQVDYEVSADELIPSSVMKVAQSYQIWGKGIPEPTFAITGINIPAKDIIGYGDNKNFIKFTYNGIDYVKKYCSKDEWKNMTLRDRNTLGENKKQLQLNIIGNFVVNEWNGNKYPQVKIKYYESREYIPDETNNKLFEIDDDFLF